MATGQTLLNWMEILFPELQLQTGESDVTKGLLALNAAQDMLETHMAQFANIRGGETTQVLTVANTEYTSFPSGVLRVDALDMLDESDTSVVDYRLDPINETGGHAFKNDWPWSLGVTNSTGKPRAFWTNGTRIYWDPTPDAVYYIRLYGLLSQTDITASGTYLYPDITILPVATLATKFVRIGLDDPVENYMQLAQETFNPVLDALDGFNRTGPSGYIYSRPHDT